VHTLVPSMVTDSAADESQETMRDVHTLMPSMVTDSAADESQETMRDVHTLMPSMVTDSAADESQETMRDGDTQFISNHLVPVSIQDMATELGSCWMFKHAARLENQLVSSPPVSTQWLSAQFSTPLHWLKYTNSTLLHNSYLPLLDKIQH